MKVSSTLQNLSVNVINVPPELDRACPVLASVKQSGVLGGLSTLITVNASVTEGETQRHCVRAKLMFKCLLIS